MSKLNLLLNEPIQIDGVGKIYQPTILDIISFGENEFNKFMIPLSVTVNSFDLDDETKELYKDFDLFFLSLPDGQKVFKYEEEDLLDILVQAFSFYFRESIAVNETEMSIYIGDNGILNRDNYDAVVDMIYQINCKQKPVIEKKPEFDNDRQRDVYEKLQAGRKRKSNEETLNLETVINSIIHGGKSYIPYEEIKKMTMFQIMNTYEAILKIEGYDSNFKVYLAGAKPSDVDLEHWSKKLKI